MLLLLYYNSNCVHIPVGLLVLFYFVFIIIIPAIITAFYTFYLRQLWKITFTTKKVTMLANAEIIFVLSEAATFILCNNRTRYSTKICPLCILGLLRYIAKSRCLRIQTRLVIFFVSLHFTYRCKMDCNNKGIHFMSSVCAQATMWQTTLFNLVVFDFVLPAVTSLRGSIYYFLVLGCCGVWWCAHYYVCLFSPIFFSTPNTMQ